MIPDGITPKVAWRGWRVVSSGGAVRLGSSNGGDVWEPGVALRAKCRYLGDGQSIATLNVADPSQMEFVKRHAIEGFTPSVYDVDEGEHRFYFTKKSYLVVPAPSPAVLVIPSFRCTCGIYGTNNIREAGNYATDGVLGRVALWGHIVQHQEGYRGQYAYPQVLYVAERGLEAAKIAFADYGVPVLPIESLPQAAKHEEPDEAIYPTGPGPALAEAPIQARLTFAELVKRLRGGA